MSLDPPLTQAQIDAAALRVKKEGYIHKWFVALDNLGAATLDVQNDQTISSQTEIDAHKNVLFHAFAVALNDGLDLIQRSHGQLAQVGDIVRAEEVIATDQAALKSETGNTAS